MKISLKGGGYIYIPDNIGEKIDPKILKAINWGIEMYILKEAGKAYFIDREYVQNDQYLLPGFYVKD